MITTATLPRHRQLDWDIALENARRNSRKGNIRMIDMEIDLDPNSMFGNISRHKIPAGDIIIKKLISESGLKKCKKSEATVLITVGDQIGGAWIAKKHKNYWLC